MFKSQVKQPFLSVFSSQPALGTIIVITAENIDPTVCAQQYR